LLGIRTRNHIHRHNVSHLSPPKLERQNARMFEPTQFGINPFPSIDTSEEPFVPRQLDETLFAHIPFQDDDQSLEDEIDNFIPSNNNISCYATPKGLDTMRSMSQPLDTTY